MGVTFTFIYWMSIVRTTYYYLQATTNHVDMLIVKMFYLTGIRVAGRSEEDVERRGDESVGTRAFHTTVSLQGLLRQHPPQSLTVLNLRHHVSSKLA